MLLLVKPISNDKTKILLSCDLKQYYSFLQRLKRVLICFLGDALHKCQSFASKASLCDRWPIYEREKNSLVLRHICSLVRQSPSFPSQFCSSWIKNSTQLQRIQYQYRRGWSQFKKTSTINCILTFWCATCPVLQPSKSPAFWGDGSYCPTTFGLILRK